MSFLLLGNSMSRSLALLLITVLMLSSLVMVGSVFAQSIPEPSVPEFTLKYVDTSYDVPAAYGVDPYTGMNVMTQAGYHEQNKSIEVTITNQPFTNYKDANGNNIRLYYDIRWKGHFGDYWHSLSINRRSHINSTALPLIASSSLMADNVLLYPNSPTTVYSYGLGGNNASNVYNSQLNEISTGDQVDFQVQAFIGYNTKFQTPPSQFDPRPSDYYLFTGESSGWSSTQTITITEGKTPTSPAPTATPYSEHQSAEQELIIGVAITVAVTAVGLGLLLYLIKRK
jgi:hypothetical protein